jgi:hypothetical protein
MKKTLSFHLIWPNIAISSCGRVTQLYMFVDPLLLDFTANKRHIAEPWSGNENIIKNLDLDFG